MSISQYEDRLRMETSSRIRFGLLPLVARTFVILEFLQALHGKVTDWSGQAAYMQAKGMHFIAPLLGAALAIEAAGSLCLLLGYRTRTAASVMFVYLGIVSVRLHAFWAMTGIAAAGTETHFFKNVGMMGGLLMLAVYGPGAWSFDAALARLDPSAKRPARAAAA
jgi:putative oxidoreductase